MSPPTLTIEGRKYRVIPEDDYRELVRTLKQTQLTQDAADAKLARKKLRDKGDRIVPYTEARKRLGLA